MQVARPSFFHKKGADVFVCNTESNTAALFLDLAYIFHIIKCKVQRTSVKLTKLNYENPQYISAGCGKLEARKTFVERRAALSNAKKHGVAPLMAIAQSGKL